MIIHSFVISEFIVATNPDRKSYLEMVESRILKSCSNVVREGNSLKGYTFRAKTEGTTSLVLTKGNQYIKGYIMSTRTLNFKFPPSSNNSLPSTKIMDEKQCNIDVSNGNDSCNATTSTSKV